MADPASLARHLRDSYADRRAPRAAAADAKLWFLALESLIRRGHLAEAAFSAAHLRVAFPRSVVMRRLAMLLATMPAAVDDPIYAGFVDRPEAEVQVVRRNGATTALLAFCGRFGSLGFPLPVAHRWFGGMGVHVVYLRDPSGELYTSGIPALGRDRAHTISALQAALADLGAIRTVCYGNSNGGYAALLYGLEMGASAVLAFNAVTILPTERVADRLGAQAQALRPDFPDIPLLYARASRRPRTHLVHGAGNAQDEASAAQFAGLAGVTIEAVRGYEGHDAHVALIERDQFGTLLRRLVEDGPEACAS